MLILTAKFRVSNEHLAEFHDFVRKATATVREKEIGSTQLYEFAADASGTRFLVCEAYGNAAALLTHLSNLGDSTAIAGRCMQIDELTVAGDLPAPVLDGLKAMVGPNVLHYSKVISSIGG
jgi:quinol monooxygenase YgiN